MDDIKVLLAQLVEANRADLTDHFQKFLRETLFINRAEVRPSQVKGIAGEEVEALLDFLQQPAFSGIKRGAQLYQTGLSQPVIMRLSQVMRQFFLPHLESSQIAPMLELVDTYQVEVMQGFIKSLETGIFHEQELTYQALQRANSHG
jgi:hypothetical protein